MFVERFLKKDLAMQQRLCQVLNSRLKVCSNFDYEAKLEIFFNKADFAVECG